MKRRVTSESKVLKPVKPSLDEDDWPQFLLTNAEVSNPDGQLVNLLFANENLPLTVTGRLERLDHADQHLLRARDLLPTTLQIDDVEHFSYGQFDSGDLAFWAAGQAGWFEIRPSRQYKNLYRDMSEAISILYFLADLHGGQKIRSLGRFKPETVLAKYANDSANRCTDTNHARALFLKQKDVLLELMSQGKEGIKWSNTSIMGYLAEEPEDDSSDTDEDTKPLGQKQSNDDDDVSGRLAGKGKSSLRPKSNKHSHKGKKGHGCQSDRGADEDEDDNMADQTLKRTSSDSPFDDSRPTKRGAHNYISNYDDSSPPGDPSSRPLPLSSTLRPARTTASLKPAGYTPNTHANRKTTLPRTDTTSTPSQILDLISSPLPSYEPNTPGDTWTCVFDGCSHRVYGASDPQSKDLIKEHYRSHVMESQKQLDLVHKEERPYLPVGHLVARVRDLAEQRKASEATSAISGMANGGGLGGGGGGGVSGGASPSNGLQHNGLTKISGGGLSSYLISGAGRSMGTGMSAAGIQQRI